MKQIGHALKEQRHAAAAYHGRARPARGVTSKTHRKNGRTAVSKPAAQQRKADEKATKAFRDFLGDRRAEWNWIDE
jgi:hypothetical protein